MIICPNCSSTRLDLSSGSCAHCGWQRLVEGGLSDYLTDQDRSSEISEKYVGNYEQLAVKNLEASNIDRRFLKNQAKNVASYVGDVTGAVVCDLGIGQGFLCDELLLKNPERVVAVDVSRSYLSRFVGQALVEPFLANAEFLPFKNEFDVLVSTDVMEHVINVGSFLFCVNRALKTDGVAAIRVPYREALLNYSPHVGYGHLFGHLRSFNKDILRMYLEQAGFRIQSMHLDGYSPGTPQPYLYSTNRRKAIYHRLLKVMNRFLDHPADATLWNSYLARLVMRPAEIVVVARKVDDLVER